MENTLQINDKYALVFGMDWCVLDSLEKRHPQIAELRAHGGRWTSSFKLNGEENVGTIAEVPQFGRKVTVLSGAAQVAMMPQFTGTTVLVLMEDAGHDGNPGLVATVGLINGNVSFDALLTPAEVVQARARFHDRCVAAEIEYQTAGLALTIAPVDTPLEWHDLLPQKVGRFSYAPQMRITPLRSGLGSKYAGIGAAVLTIGFASYLAFDEYTIHQQRKRALAEAQRVDPALLYAAAAQSFLAEPKVLAKDAFPVIRASIGKLPINLSGWRLDTVSCTSSQCLLKWQRDGGTFEEFKKNAPQEWKDFVYSDDGKSLSNTVSISIPRSKLPDRGTWLTKMDFKEQEVSKWQRYADVGLTAEVGKTSLQAVPAGVAPAAVEYLPDAIKSASWEVKGGSKWYASDGFDTTPPYITFESLTATISQSEVTFEAKGNVYVKN